MKNPTQIQNFSVGHENKAKKKTFFVSTFSNFTFWWVPRIIEGATANLVSSSRHHFIKNWSSMRKIENLQLIEMCLYTLSRSYTSHFFYSLRHCFEILLIFAKDVPDFITICPFPTGTICIQGADKCKIGAK